MLWRIISTPHNVSIACVSYKDDNTNIQHRKEKRHHNVSKIYKQVGCTKCWQMQRCHNGKVLLYNRTDSWCHVEGPLCYGWHSLKRLVGSNMKYVDSFENQSSVTRDDVSSQSEINGRWWTHDKAEDNIHCSTARHEKTVVTIHQGQFGMKQHMIKQFQEAYTPAYPTSKML